MLTIEEVEAGTRTVVLSLTTSVAVSFVVLP